MTDHKVRKISDFGIDTFLGVSSHRLVDSSLGGGPLQSPVTQG